MVVICEVLIRQYQPSDQQSVKRVLLDGVYTNMWPAYKNALLRREALIFASLLFSMFSLIIDDWLMIIGAAIVGYFGVVYLVIRIAALAYFHASCSDLNDIEKCYQRDAYSNFWVAQFDGDIVGTVAIVAREDVLAINGAVAENTSPLGKTAFLRRMAVCKRRRKMGIGLMLIETAVNFCRRNSYDSVQLITTQLQNPAQRLYLKYGFKSRVDL
ncbi:N-acetyltransferase 8F1-like [Tubulanus polymorphus]|uniref:N-acetyltransferase 8F1-like n=1 Tax=Tubulanus polymorphus TaxID=672921 RepID=UPI003DA2F160